MSVLPSVRFVAAPSWCRLPWLLAPLLLTPWAVHAGQMHDLGIFPDGPSTQGTAISGNGQVIAGNGADASNTQWLFFWRAAVGGVAITSYTGADQCRQLQRRRTGRNLALERRATGVPLGCSNRHYRPQHVGWHHKPRLGHQWRWQRDRRRCGQRLGRAPRLSLDGRPGYAGPRRPVAHGHEYRLCHKR